MTEPSAGFGGAPGKPPPGFAPPPGDAPPSPGNAAPPGAPPSGYGPPGAPPPGYAQPGQPPPSPGYVMPGAGMAPPGMMMQPIPAPLPGCPAGLEYLTQLEKVVVQSEVELLEAMTGFEVNNKYRVFNDQGQQFMFIMEESACCERQCCGKARGFIMHITDNCNREVIRLVRPAKYCAVNSCCASPGNCCSQEMTIEAPPGTVIGYARQHCSACKLAMGLYDVENQMIGLVKGPCCPCSGPCCGDVEFPIWDPKEQDIIGTCAKTWTGIIKELFTKADNFYITFPIELDVRTKAIFFGALMLIDFMYFEHDK